MTNGFAEIGAFGVPWVLFGVYAFGVLLVLIAVRLRAREQATPAGVPTESAGRHSTGSSLAVRRVVVVAGLLPVLAFSLVRGWDPLWAGAVMAPGPQVAEVRADGTWVSDSIQDESSYSSSPDDCTFECPGPHWIYRVRPGQTYAFIVSIWNHGSVPIKIVGRPLPPDAPAHPGLALLENPAVVSADPSNLIPFQPVTIDAGATATVVWIDTASSCANPTATVKFLEPGAGSATGYPFLYDILGWRREGVIWPHFSTSVAGCDARPEIVN